MDRVINYPTAEVLIEDVLNTNRHALIGLGALIQMTLGQNIIADGFTPTPGTGLTVTVAGGSLSYLGVVDATAYGVLAVDTNPLMRQAIALTATTVTVPAAGTWLISVSAVQADANNAVLGFVDAANPAIPFSGPGGAGGLLPTVRQDHAVLEITSGTAVPAGSQPLWVVTVPSGATSVMAGDITLASGAPYITKMPFLAPINSPTFTGSPKAPTPATGDNSTAIATTAFAQTVVAPEVTAREAADTTLQTNINNEATARANADTTLQTNINNEATAREAADTTLQTNINNEATARNNADMAVEAWTSATFATPAMVVATIASEFTSGLGSPGWQKLSSGLILQWGSIASPAGNYSFPITFPNGCWLVLAGNTNTQGAGVDNAFAYPVSSTQFYMATKSNSGFLSAYSCCWFAIGY